MICSARPALLAVAAGIITTLLLPCTEICRKTLERKEDFIVIAGSWLASLNGAKIEHLRLYS